MFRLPSRLLILSTAAGCSFGLAACRTVGSDARDRPAAASSEPPRAAPSGSLAAAAGSARAPSPEPETPLAWGTRPPTKGPLYPVVDGMCVHGEIWPTAGSAVYTYGNGTGAWTRGGQATVARFVDDGLDVSDGVGKSNDAEAWAWIAPMAFTGSWPAPLLMYSSDQGNGRTRDWPSIWTHDESGWKLLASHREPGEPLYTKPVVFKGHAVAARAVLDAGYDAVSATTVKAWALDKGAPPIANVAQLARARFEIRTLAEGDGVLYALGTADAGNDSTRGVIRALQDGKIEEVLAPAGSMHVVGTRPSLVVTIGGTQVFRLTGRQLSEIKLPPGAELADAAVHPSGDVWMLTKKKTVLVARRAPPAAVDTIETTPLPAPAAPGPKEAVQHWPTSGGLLAGVEVDDPHAIGEGGSLFHFEAGKWQEVALPAPPFATTGKYQAQAVVVPAKGSVYVNAGYAEKGPSWRSVERYRAVLRNVRPREVLRCNEPSGGANYASGTGFMSFPPIATDACTMPFVILLRLAYGMTRKEPVYIYDPKSDYPSVREAIKATPSLGAAVDLVELVSGDQRYLGARVPNVAAGRELAEAVAKRIRGPSETRPEIVCGAPKEERVIHVDVATGKVASPIVGR